MPTSRASMAQKKTNRTIGLGAYQQYCGVTIPPLGRMNQLTARFSSFANTVQTRMNTSTGTVSALGGTLEAQVNQALSQVLRQPGGSPANVLSRPGDDNVAALVGGYGGAAPAMSPFQAALLREGRITQADSLSILGSLQPLSPFTDPGDVAALQAVVRAEINGLLEEFSYTRLLPRQQRVRVFLGGLLGWNYDSFAVQNPLLQGAPAGDIQALMWLLNLGGPLIPTIPIEDQLASQQVVGTDGALFDAQWQNYWTSALLNNWTTQFAQPTVNWALWEPGLGLGGLPPVPSGLGSWVPAAIPNPNVTPLGPRGPQLGNQAAWRLGVVNSPAASQASYAEKMIQVDLLLPVIAEDASRVENSLSAIGYTTGEQETTFAWFWSAVDADQLPQYGTPAAALPIGFPGSPGSPVTLPQPSAANWAAVLGTAGQWGVVNPMMPIPVRTTVADILDWAKNLTGPSAYDQLRQAGALGLNLLCDQADELFWLALAMLDPTVTPPITALSDTETQLEIYSLATDLNQLANLAY
jgi:hypothetical protein